MKINELIYGNLLGDASIRSDKSKYFTYQIVAKDKKFLKWLKNFFKGFGIKRFEINANYFTLLVSW